MFDFRIGEHDLLRDATHSKVWNQLFYFLDITVHMLRDVMLGTREGDIGMGKSSVSHSDTACVDCVQVYRPTQDRDRGG